MLVNAFYSLYIVDERILIDIEGKLSLNQQFQQKATDAKRILIRNSKGIYLDQRLRIKDNSARGVL